MVINKKNILSLVFIVLSMTIMAQKREGTGYEKIKAERKVFIAEGLDLNEEQEEIFWPIYNLHVDNVHVLMKENRKGRMKRADMTEADAQLQLEKMIDLKRKELELQLSFYQELEEVLTAIR